MTTPSARARTAPPEQSPCSRRHLSIVQGRPGSASSRPVVLHMQIAAGLEPLVYLTRVTLGEPLRPSHRPETGRLGADSEPDALRKRRLLCPRGTALTVLR
jgi:hypothetical protein